MEPCRAGYYCEVVNGTGNAEEVKCPKGSYCPKDEVNNIGCTRPIKCPAGSADLASIDENRVGPNYGITEEGTCEVCKAGQKGSADRSQCVPCRAGVICMEGALDDTPLPRNQDSFH